MDQKLFLPIKKLLHKSCKKGPPLLKSSNTENTGINNIYTVLKAHKFL